MAAHSSFFPDTHDSSSLKRKRPLRILIPDLLQEIQTPKLNDSKALEDDVCFSGLGFGVLSVKGKKLCMEDAHKIVSSLESNPKKGFFGVYDGHGGRKAAEFVVENLHANILKMVENCLESRAKEEAVKAGYLKTDEEFLKKGIGSGACCVTALIQGKEIVVSNVGDCRAVLCRGGVAEVLTRDHRVELEDERRRIEEKGGYVEIHRGAWRIHGVLSVSRSIGDAHLKEWVVAEPDTKILPLTADMEFLVLASDGLWEEVGNQEAVDTVTRLCRNEEKLGSLGDEQNDVDDDYGQVNVSPSLRLRRVSLVKQSSGHKKTLNGLNEVGEDDFRCENESPPSKSRRISSAKRVFIKKETPVKPIKVCKKSATSGLLPACKELVNLAVGRGTLDDITVMIIDLKHYMCNI
ncbi:probable protein phosphatase 2C 14 [Prosopis cineraria]|uniref:probable protein phosphatase 2C 14 n=1 Tax=Prosopis cineraria TaxID=364024 RepID=UPI00240EFC90|nr:probable protein phosphatase 2C 14 [Prosopis cineraria]